MSSDVSSPFTMAHHGTRARYDQELHDLRTQRRDKESKAATLRCYGGGLGPVAG